MPYIANKRNVAQITNVHFWDSAGNVWSGNLIGAATPFAFLPNPVVAADLVVFGIDTTVLDSGPFCSLVFDIGAAITGVTAGAWLYSDAGGADPNTWQDFITLPGPIQDNTDQSGLMTGVAFDTSGVGSVHWEQPPLWIVQNPTIGGVALGVTGYWVCWDPTAAAAATPPTQNNRDIYSILWPAVEIAEVGGDIPVLARVRLRCESSDDTVALPEANRIIVGSRRVDRGADFVSHINLSPEQNPAGISYGPITFADVQTPTGWKGRVILNVAWVQEAQVNLVSGIAEQYRGEFRAFMRVESPNTGVDVRLDMALYSGGVAGGFENLWFSSDVATLGSTTNWEVLDFGRVQLVPDDIDDSDVFNVEVRIMMQRPAGAITMHLYDLILIPVDEWAGEFDMVPTGSTPWGERQTIGILGSVVDMDSVTIPRRAMNSVLRNWTTGDFSYRPRFIGRAPMSITPNETTRLYFLIIDDDPTYVQSVFELSGSATMEIVERYLSMRGDR